MTDNETIKALEKWCDDKCKKVCPRLKICDKCVVTYIKSVLDLNSRQKAEIEELQTDGETLAISLLNAKKEIEGLKDRNVELWKENRVAYKKVKSEAIKEFTEKLKASQIITHRSKEGFCVYEFDDELIDTLVEEMTVNYESSTNDKHRKEARGNE